MGLSGPKPVYRDANDARSLDAAGLTSLTCDVSFASDATAPPEALVTRQVERLQNPKFTALWWDIFDRLRGEAVVPHRTRAMSHVHAALRDASIDIDSNWLDALVRFFDQLNEVMFEQQTLDWLVDGQFKLHLYGSGWENHPRFATFARGEIDSDAMRLAIYRASRINLAASAYGALTPRVSEGIGAGGFFLLRFTPADLLERFYPPIWEFCFANQIETNAQLNESATPSIRNLLDFAGRTIGVEMLEAWPDFVAELRSAADAGYTRSAAAVFAGYPAVSFSSKDELLGLVQRYLYDLPQRQRLAEAMRRELRARFEHISIDRPLIADPRSPVAA